ncbi:MAG: GntR family transcriptional regulator [Candidatus Dormibacterales bacterium]
MTGLPAITVNTESPVPPFEQIRAQISALIAGGELRRDDRLPSVRQLAADLGLAAGTAARAYRELEAAGLIRTRRGGGSRVVTPAAPQAENRDELVLERAVTFVRLARQLGAADSDLLAAIYEAMC